METKRWILRDQSVLDNVKVFLSTIAVVQDQLEFPIFEIICREYKKNRSLAQNSLMWMWLGIIVNHLRDENGVSTDSMSLKDYFQRRFLGFVTSVLPDGRLDERVIGTSELNTRAFSEFLNRIEVYCGSDLGLNLPHPEDLYYEAMGL